MGERIEKEYADRINASYRKLASCLSHEDSSFMKQLIRIRDQVTHLSADVHEYDYADVKVNGFRVGIEYVIRLFEYGSKRFASSWFKSSGGKADHEFKQMVTMFEAGLVYFQQLREATKETKSLIDSNVDILNHGFMEYFDRNGMDAGFGPMTGFFFPEPEAFYAYYFYIGIGVVAGGTVANALKSLVDFKTGLDPSRVQPHASGAPEVDRLLW